MISLSDSMNRVKIISINLTIKLSEILPFHPHPELVSPTSVPKLRLFLCLTLPDWVTHAHSFNMKPVAPKYVAPAQSFLLTSQLTYSITSRHFHLDCYTRSPDQACPKPTHQDLCFQVHIRPDGWMCAVVSSQDTFFSVITPDIYTECDHLASFSQTCPSSTTSSLRNGANHPTKQLDQKV